MVPTFLYLFLLFFYNLGETNQSKLNVLRPGKIPGAKIPGDISYFTTKCLEAPSITLQSIVELGKASKTSRRNLLSKMKGKAMRPDGWILPHLTRNDLILIDSLIMHFADYQNYCPFLTRTCVVPGINYYMHDKKSDKLLKRNFSLHQVSEMISIEKGSWGTCALVGLGDTLLRTKKGHEIDAHDVVIRLGELPLQKYSEFVGIKTDATWVRRLAKMSARGTISSERKNVRWYIGHNNGNMQMPTLSPFGFLRQTSPTKQFIGFAGEIYEIFRNDNWNRFNKGKKKARDPSTGFRYALSLIFSGFCTRIDLYGFSFNGGGAYHDRSHKMQMLHNCELESWIFHHIMKEYPWLGVCVHL